MSKSKPVVIGRKLTDVERVRLHSYFDLADSFADLVGPHCEIVIHSLENLEHSVVKIVNGHHTGRTVNSPITDLGLRMLKLYQKTNECVSKSYFTNSKTGGLMKSTTCILKGDEGSVIGLFCININLSLPFPEIIQTLMPEPNQLALLNNQQETFSSNAHDVIHAAVEKAVEEVDLNSDINLKMRNKSIVHLLYENGVFELKDATNIVADHLNITRHAVYKHLRDFKSLN